MVESQVVESSSEEPKKEDVFAVVMVSLGLFLNKDLNFIVLSIWVF